MTLVAVDLFAGPGGWDEGIRDLGIEPLGIEWDAAACATRAAAGHQTLQADVADLEPLNFPCDLLIGSPPCQAFSVAGDGKGREDVEFVTQCARNLSIGVDVRATMRAKLQDERSMLVVEPLRWALALRPRFIALEQVPPVLEFWRYCARVLDGLGYSTWAGILNAVDYGVPQKRERAFLIASQEGSAHPPHATHCDGGALTFEGELPPWVTMAAALGWGMSERPYPTIACSRTTGGPDMEKVGGSGARASLYAEKDRGAWVGRSENAIRVSLDEAAILQGFPVGYPWKGNKSDQFRQVGNAVPPPLACAVITALVGAE